MPVSDPSSGRMFIWIIAETSSSLDTRDWGTVGLLCLPWLFWLLTFLYRIFSRIFGCRVSVGGGNWVPTANADVEVAVASHAKGDNLLNRASSVASHESEMTFAKSMAT
ncbi:hypothetical protein GYH30_013171 [Glycine max]|uniref:Uncharacterized protein n=2 Tax=Glycine subgen. Soja TaxID=1462606 RepID=A0A0R0K7Q4_SOYBN|nr:hypothetical protein GYH30_013171 [Glycine max]RZC13212.1 hypothetical protein D0Y65_012773 [Glycine soja]